MLNKIYPYVLFGGVLFTGIFVVHFVWSTPVLAGNDVFSKIALNIFAMIPILLPVATLFEEKKYKRFLSKIPQISKELGIDNHPRREKFESLALMISLKKDEKSFRNSLKYILDLIA